MDKTNARRGIRIYAILTGDLNWLLFVRVRPTREN